MGRLFGGLVGWLLVVAVAVAVAVCCCKCDHFSKYLSYLTGDK